MRRLLLSCALLLATAGTSGCASRLLHRGASPAVTTLPAPGDPGSAVTTVRSDETKAERRRAKQEAREQARAAKAAARAARNAHGTQPQAAPGATEAPSQSAEAQAASPEGQATLRARMQQQPSEPWWPYKLALLEAKAGRGGAAEDLLRAAIGRDSAYAPALTQLSRMLYEQGRHAEAITVLAPVRDHRVSLPPDERAAVLAGLALHEAALGDEAAARTTMGMLARDERDGALGVSAYLAVRAASADSAVKLTARAVQAAPGSAAAHNNRGIALLRAADPDGAATEFERAIALDPSRPGPYYNLAILERWYRLDPATAAKRFRQYWSLSHADPDSLYAELGREPAVPVAEGPNK